MSMVCQQSVQCALVVCVYKCHEGARTLRVRIQDLVILHTKKILWVRKKHRANSVWPVMLLHLSLVKIKANLSGWPLGRTNCRGRVLSHTIYLWLQFLCAQKWKVKIGNTTENLKTAVAQTSEYFSFYGKVVQGVQCFVCFFLFIYFINLTYCSIWLKVA